MDHRCLAKQLRTYLHEERRDALGVIIHVIRGAVVALDVNRSEVDRHCREVIRGRVARIQWSVSIGVVASNKIKQVEGREDRIARVIRIDT